jgi:uncharacterized protein involved in type VI secretion and phage assembly
MRSFQSKILDAMEQIAVKVGLDVVQESDWANTGRILAQDGFTTVATAKYEFQGKAMILFNGAKHGPPGDDNYWFDASDGPRIEEMLDRWDALCRKRVAR